MPRRRTPEKLHRKSDTTETWAERVRREIAEDEARSRDSFNDRRDDGWGRKNPVRDDDD